jgi:type VI secretion system protein ImpE
MTAEESIRAGKLEEALASLQSSVRANPTDAGLRVCLFQLQCVLGNWEKAMTQLKVLADLNPETMMLARIFGPVVNCEIFRAEVFQGKRTPIIFGEPMEWVGLLMRANEHVARGEFAAAQSLREQAFEAAPATSGKLNGHDFAWMADADSRLGPILEVILEGKYYWVPFCRIKKIVMEKPSDLRDLVWKPAVFIWTNGGEASAHIPTRYPGTESSPDNQLRLARRTDWLEREGGACLGLGQRIIATDTEELPLLECQSIDLSSDS